MILVSCLTFRDFRVQMEAELNVEDFIMYWSSGRILLKGQNPYSPENLLGVQKSVGWSRDIPLQTFNPPWGLAIILPFAWDTYINAKIAWLFFHLFLLFMSAFLLWRMFNGAGSVLLAFLVVFCFPPTLIYLKRGQISSLILLGVILFLFFQRRKQDFLAGIATTLVAIKPHVACLFWLPLFLWGLSCRRFFVFLGMASGLLVLSSISVAFDPGIFEHYRTIFSQNSPMLFLATPTLGGHLRNVFGLEKEYLQVFPFFLGLVWVFWHWWRKKENWDWEMEFPLILAISLVASSYIWISDYILFFPAILQAVSWISHQFSPEKRTLEILKYFFFILAFWLFYSFISRNEFWLIWAWFIIFAMYFPLYFLQGPSVFNRSARGSSEQVQQ